MSSLALSSDFAKLSCMEESEAMKKFWEIPELVERLFTFLDASSTLSLARAHPPSVRILQGGANWAQFIRRSCPSPVINYKSKPANLTDCDWAVEAAELKKEEMRPVVQLLKMMKNPRSYLLYLLDIICERFGGTESFQDRFGAAIVMGCPRHTNSHTVDAVGFLLLEQVEAAMGSSEQKLEWLQISQMVGDLTSAFRARVLRQEGSELTTSSAAIRTMQSNYSPSCRGAKASSWKQFSSLEQLGLVGGPSWQRPFLCFKIIFPPFWLLRDRSCLKGKRRT